MIRNQGIWQGKQIISLQAAKDISTGGSKIIFAKGDHPELRNWSYHDMWLHTGNALADYLMTGKD